MRLTSKKSAKEAKIELQMTSLIDVVFLLLIFFMVTTSVAQSERQLRPAIKVDEETTSESISDREPAIVLVVRSNNRYVYKVDAHEFSEDDAEGLKDLLSSFDNKLDGAFVRVSDDAPFEMAATAVQTCRSAGFLSVSYVPIADNN